MTELGCGHWNNRNWRLKQQVKSLKVNTDTLCHLSVLLDWKVNGGIQGQEWMDGKTAFFRDSYHKKQASDLNKLPDYYDL